VWLILLTFVAAAGAVAQSTAVDPNSIAIRVGEIEVTLKSFSQAYHIEATRQGSTITPDREGVETFLDQQIEQLLAHAWIMQDTFPMIRQDFYLGQLGIDRILQDALRKELLPQYLPTDDEVLRAVYDRMGTQLRLATIKVSTLVDLDSAQTELAAGESFERVARRWSQDPTSSRRGGDLGWVDASRFRTDTQELLWALPAGATSEPVAEPQFHAIYKVIDRRDAPTLPSFEDARKEIIAGIHRIELPRVAGEIHDDLLAAYNFRVDREAAEWLREFLHRETAGVRRRYDPEKDKPYARIGEPTEERLWEEAPLEGEEAARPVAYIDGDTLSALEVIDELVFTPGLTWPTFDSVTDVIDLCDSALYYRVQIQEALRLGLDKRPDVARDVKEKQRWMYYHAYRRAKIFPEVNPTDEEVRALYQERLPSYELPERRRFHLVNAPTRELAERARSLFLEGRLPTEIFRELHVPGQEYEITPDTTIGWVALGETPRVDGILFSLDEGDVSEVFPDQGRYSVLRVDGVSQPHTIRFEDVEILLRREIIKEREARVLARIAEDARSLFEVEVDRDLIARMEIDYDRIRERNTLPGQ
jgi:parvulin-like peptidyl-prolyl isomerase